MNIPTILLLLITTLFAFTWNKDALHRDAEGKLLAQRPVIERNAVAAVTEYEREILARRNTPTFNVASHSQDAEGPQGRLIQNDDSRLY